MEPRICTIISRNYLYYARALVKSLRAHHPSAKVWVLVVDACEPFFDPRSEDFTVVRITDLKLPNETSWMFRYTPFEVCNSLKPALIRHILKDLKEPAVLYLDSDIGIFSPLQRLWESILQTGLLLTPHCLSDFPNDGKWPERGVLQTAGIFNAGVIGATSGRANAFLDWWHGVLEYGCVVDLAKGQYVDQRYLDLVPAWFPDFAVCRDPGVNVAHFNLHERKVTQALAGWQVGESPLVAFHFTQVNWEQSTFWPPVNRPLTAQQPDVKLLIDHYAQTLNACGWKTTRSWPGGYDHFSNGLKISPQTRLAFRTQYPRSSPSSNPFEDVRWQEVERAGQRRRSVQEWISLPKRIVRRLTRKS